MDVFKFVTGEKISFMFSNTAKYAMRAVIYMAMHQGDNDPAKIGIKKMAEDLDMPVYFLGKIMQTLAKNKILNSYKGPNGGFTFNVDPDELSLLDIVKIFDGTDVFDNCLLGLNLCKDNPEMRQICPLADNLDTCVAKLYDYLDSKKVGQIAKSLKDIKEFVMI